MAEFSFCPGKQLIRWCMIRFAHIAFKADNARETLTRLLQQHGGMQLGDLIETEIPSTGHLTFVYARDPDGNIIEIRHW